MTLKESIRKQNGNRELWKGNDTPEAIAYMIDDEASELVEAIQESLLSGDVFSVVSEIGDLLYLLNRLCIDLGIDPDDAMKMKLLRNSLKYSDYVMSNGDFAKATELSKNMWQMLGGDEAFSHAYLELFGGTEDE